MTLVLALANENEVHISCDFKLTDARTGRTVSVGAHKLVPVEMMGLQAVVGVTGLAILEGIPVGDWIAQRTANLGREATLDTLIESLRESSSVLARVLPSVRKYRHMTFVIAAMQGSQSVIALLSNYQSLRGHFIADDAVPGSDLRLDVARPSSPRLVLAGQVGAVRKEERKALERLLRSGSLPDVTRAHMAALNKRAAGRSSAISEGCNVATELATGRGEIQPFLVEQTGDFIMPNFEAMFASMGLRLNPAVLPDGTAAPIQLRGATSVRYNPSPTYFREQFKLTPDSAELWNNFGAYELSNGRLESAQRAYEKALDLEPGYVHAARNLGILLWRVRGDRTKGRELIEVALRAEDANFMRETLSLLAELTAGFDGDTPEVRQCFADSMNGEALTAVTARWAMFLLSFDAARSSEAEVLSDEILTREPHYSVAVAGKALCLWLLHGDIPESRLMIESASNRYPKEELLAVTALRIAIADGDVVGANVFLRRLERIEGSESAIVLAFSGYLGILKGKSLSEVGDMFRRAGGEENEINLAATLWADGQQDAFELHVDSIECAGLGVDGKVELGFLRGQLRGSGSSQLKDECMPVRDRSLLWALRNHPQLDSERREKIDVFVGASHG